MACTRAPGSHRSRSSRARLKPEYATSSSTSAPATAPDLKPDPHGATVRPIVAATSVAPRTQGQPRRTFGSEARGPRAATATRTSAMAATGSTRAMASTGHAWTHAGPVSRSAHRSHFTATCSDRAVPRAAPVPVAALGAMCTLPHGQARSH